MQLPKRIYLICWKRALLEKEDTKSWKMCLSKPKSSNITMAKTYFWTLTVAQSCLTSLTVSLWLCATQLQWLQIFICFLVCSHSPLCPTWLLASPNEMEKALPSLSPKSCWMDRKHIQKQTESWEEPCLPHLWGGFTASQLSLISQQQFPWPAGLVTSVGKEAELRSWATCDTGKRKVWNRDGEGKD